MKRLFSLFLVLVLLMANTVCSAQELTNSVNASGKCEKEVWYLNLNGSVGYLSVKWQYENPRLYIVQYDAYMRPIKMTPSKGVLNEVFEILPQTARIEAVYEKDKQSVRSYKLYSARELPADVAQWSEPYEKCDLMVIVAHQDDEWLWFGGMIPYYELLQGKNVTVVYMAKCSRERYDEALAGLWEGGLTHSPVFLGMKDERTDYETTINDWGGMGTVNARLVEVIRKYKPEVIVTHGSTGEYGHNQHIITSHAVEVAISLAANADAMYASYALYGTWQVKKMYRHEDGDNAITMDWNVTVPSRNGISVYQIAENAYHKHVSQQQYYTIYNGGTYDNRVFNLVYSCVGDDEEKNDLFENIA